MGTGKTTVGRLLAERLGFDFVDTDAIIEDRHGPIEVIFAEQGEAAFRTIEQQVADELADREQLVIATGGRMMLDDANVASLSRNGRVFCLVTTADDILERVTADRARVERPLLAVADPGQRVAELLEERAPAYRRFAQVSTLGRPPTDIADELAALATTTPERVDLDPSGHRAWVVGAALLPLLRDLAGIHGPIVIVADTSASGLLPQCPAPDLLIMLRPEIEQADQVIATELAAITNPRAATIVSVGRRATFEAADFAARRLPDIAAIVHCPTGLDLPDLPGLGVIDVAVLQSPDTVGHPSALIARTVQAIRSTTIG